MSRFRLRDGLIVGSAAGAGLGLGALLASKEAVARKVEIESFLIRMRTLGVDPQAALEAVRNLALTDPRPSALREAMATVERRVALGNPPTTAAAESG